MEKSAEKSNGITEMLREWGGGKKDALDALLPLVYHEMHAQAARFLRRERANHTFQTTDLIQETYLKLIDQREVNWESRTHFYAIAATLMRRILVDYARRKRSEKRGGDVIKLTLNEDALAVSEENNIDLMALDEALTRLEKFDRQQARIVELRYFSGLSLEETAAALNISRTTVATDWNMAKAWLHRELTR